MERFYAIHNTPIFLGRQGENNAREVAFDIGGWLETYGEGTVQLFARRSGESAVYPVPFHREGRCVLWTVTEADVGIVGQSGECELTYQPDEDTLVKSETWATFVLPSMDGNVGEAPDAARAWIDAMRRETANQQKIADAAALSATEAAQSAGTAGGRAQAAQGYMLSAQEAAMAAGMSASGAQGAANAAEGSAKEAKTAQRTVELYVDGAANSAAAAAASAVKAEEAAKRAENAGGGGGGGGGGGAGEPGKDGVSPTVDVEVITGGHRVIITDVEGTESFDVMNGKDGQPGSKGDPGKDGVGISSVAQTTTSGADGGENVITVTKTDGSKSTFTVRNGSKGEPGYTPVKGTDYWTAADQQSIVDAVLAALPAAEEASF